MNHKAEAEQAAINGKHTIALYHAVMHNSELVQVTNRLLAIQTPLITAGLTSSQADNAITALKELDLS